MQATPDFALDGRPTRQADSQKNDGNTAGRILLLICFSFCIFCQLRNRGDSRLDSDIANNTNQHDLEYRNENLPARKIARTG
jgi:hypothetical protein